MVSKRAKDEVGAVFPDRAAARAAVTALSEAEIADPHLAVAIDGRERRVYELDIDRETFAYVRRAVLVGLPLGALAGTGLVAAGILLAHTGAPPMDALAAGGLPGVIEGLFAGGFAGVLAAAWMLDSERRWQEIPLGDGEVLVVAQAHGRTEEVRAILTHHGGDLVEASSSTGPLGRVAARPHART